MSTILRRSRVTADALSDRVEDMSEFVDRLVRSISPEDLPEDSYRRVLNSALAGAADAQRRLLAMTRELDRLRRLSVTDETTGILNKRGFNGSLERALARVRRSGESGLLMLIDLDAFKQINDRYGHQAGDLVLASIATVLRRNIRETDTVARIGGDEFAVILSDADPGKGMRKAEQLEAAINRVEVPWNDALIPIGASVGVASYGPDDLPEDLINRADQKMYRAKHTAFRRTR